MDFSILVRKIAISYRVLEQNRHSCIFKTDVREGAKVIMTHTYNTNMRYVKSKIVSPENQRILTWDVVLPNERNIQKYNLANDTNLCIKNNLY